jgi:hypothetical protein
MIIWCDVSGWIFRLRLTALKSRYHIHCHKRHGTDDIQIGEVDYLAYHFINTPYDVRRIDFTNESQNSYQLGELDIQVSQNSTDDLDGDWTTIDHVDRDFGPLVAILQGS